MWKKKLIFGGLNPDGALSKLTTIKKTKRETACSVWIMQETKVAQPGNIKFGGFVTFEHTRINKDGVDLALSALETLNTVFLRDGGEEVEALTVMIHLRKITISCNTAYGPQENAVLENKEKFWAYLDDEYQRASNAGNDFVLQGDLNSWVGPETIPGDNRKMNQNGKMLVNFVRRNKLTIGNSLPICQGTTTWTRKRLGVKHVGTIDFFEVCHQVLPYIQEMKIYSGGTHKITNFKLKQNVTESDHFPMWMKVNIKITPERPSQEKILNFRDKTALINFKESKSTTREFSYCFKSNLSLKTKINQWKHVLDNC